jgi:cysteine synthase B
MFDQFPTIGDYVGNTPLVRLQRIEVANNNVILCKLEGNNPAGSVKDRPAMSMIERAQSRGDIKPGDTIIEATSGNTGIALAMAAAIKGYKMILIMPDNMSTERKTSMSAYGAQLIEVSSEQGMEYARDLAKKMHDAGEGIVLDQFANADNPIAHYETTGPEIWQQSQQRITHFVSSMGTTGTIMGTSAFLKEKNPNIQIIGLQPEDGASIPGIRRWPKAYLPAIFDETKVDLTLDISQIDAEQTMKKLATHEGIFCGVSSGGAVAGAIRIAEQVSNSVIVCIICDRGDRYLSTGVFDSK